METALFTLPTGTALEREIEAIETAAHDEQVRKTIAERIAEADAPGAVFIAHEEVFAASRAKLMAMLRQQDNA